MRLILSQFLRTLRERDEFDRLLPDLLLALGYVPLAKPQGGVRQFGVDLAAVGKSPVDGADELLLFVIKRGDIGRRDWDNGEPTCVGSSINEALDFYLTKLVAPEHQGFRKVIVVATTGDMKQEAETNWTGFKEYNKSRASFDFWGADKVSDLIETSMLDEHLFDADDRSDLRRALALVGDADYDFRDVRRLFLRQMGLAADGSVGGTTPDARKLKKVIPRLRLAAQICVRWTQGGGDCRQALWVCERAMLWIWHRMLLVDSAERVPLLSEMSQLWHSYMVEAARYVERIQPYAYARDGMASHGPDGASIAIVLFEHIGLLASIGLAILFQGNLEDDTMDTTRSNVEVVANTLCALIENHPATASPRLDGHAIDIGLAQLFLTSVDRSEKAKSWMEDLAGRLDYVFRTNAKFPVASDSFEDLVALDVGPIDDAHRARLRRVSWCLATVAGWCAVLDARESYARLATNSREQYSDVCAQLWHPGADWPRRWYFGGVLDSGTAEAPYAMPEDIEQMRARMAKFLDQAEYEWVLKSPSRNAGIFGLDFIACRYFRVPVPASAWYRAGPRRGLIQTS